MAVGVILAGIEAEEETGRVSIHRFDLRHPICLKILKRLRIASGEHEEEKVTNVVSQRPNSRVFRVRRHVVKRHRDRLLLHHAILTENVSNVVCSGLGIRGRDELFEVHVKMGAEELSASRVAIADHGHVQRAFDLHVSLLLVLLMAAPKPLVERRVSQ